jgi:hypothetical protein
MDLPCVLLLHLQRENASLNSSRRAGASVASKNTNLLNATHVLFTHTRIQGLWPMKRHLLPLHILLPELQSPAPTARNGKFREALFQVEECGREIK